MPISSGDFHWPEDYVKVVGEIDPSYTTTLRNGGKPTDWDFIVAQNRILNRVATLFDKNVYSECLRRAAVRHMEKRMRDSHNGD